MDTERRSDVLYTDEMNRDFYKQKIGQEIQRSFEESRGIRVESLVHPKNPSLRARQVLSLLPCPELLGQKLFDVHLGNKLEKTDEAELFNREGLVGRVDFSEFNEKTFKVFCEGAAARETRPGEKSGEGGGQTERVPPAKEELGKAGEYAVLWKKLGRDEDRKLLLMVINREESAEIKELDYSLFLRNKKKQLEPETLLLEEDLEEERRFQQEEHSKVRSLDSFLAKRLSQLYPVSEGILWDRPHPPAKRHSKAAKAPAKLGSARGEIPEEVSAEDSLDSLLSD